MYKKQEQMMNKNKIKKTMNHEPWTTMKNKNNKNNNNIAQELWTNKKQYLNLFQFSAIIVTRISIFLILSLIVNLF